MASEAAKWRGRGGNAGDRRRGFGADGEPARLGPSSAACAISDARAGLRRSLGMDRSDSAGGAVSGRHHAGPAATAVRSLCPQPPMGGFAPPSYPPPIPYGGQPVYPPGGLDPRFATPGPSAIYPPGPTTSPNAPYPNSNYDIFGPDGSVTQVMRFMQGVSLEHTWLAGEMGRDLEINDTDLQATFAFPIFPNREHPLLVSPGFGLHLWDGPEAPEAGIADLPSQAYDAYMDFTWRPRFNELLAAELAFRPGVYSDLEAVSSDSLAVAGSRAGVHYDYAAAANCGRRRVHRPRGLEVFAGLRRDLHAAREGAVRTSVPKAEAVEISADLRAEQRLVDVFHGRIWRRLVDDRAARPASTTGSTSTTSG